MPNPAFVKGSYTPIGLHDDWRLFSRKVLHRCRGRIKNCVLGNDPRNSRMSRFLSIIQKLADKSLRGYIPELENFPYADNSDIYTPQTAGKAYKRLVKRLKRFARKTDIVIAGDWCAASVVTTAAAGMRRDVVFMALLDESLPARDAHKAKRFLERLAAYEIALESLKQVLWKRRSNSSHPLFTSEIAISLLPPNYMSLQPPTLEELSSSVMTVDKHRLLQFPPTVYESYTSISTDVDLEEHCEIRLVRFYIENPDTASVLPYLGISKLSCLQCSVFLRCLQDPGLPGVPVKFATRGNHGKVYGKWLPFDDTRATGAIRDRVLESLQCVAEEIRTRSHQGLKRLGSYDSLYSSSDETWSFMEKRNPLSGDWVWGL